MTTTLPEAPRHRAALRNRCSASSRSRASSGTSCRRSTCLTRTTISRSRSPDRASSCRELGELDVIRHFTHLAQRNFSIDSVFYPLGSCTMKYNPRINEDVARLPGIAHIHPLQPDETVQGALRADVRAPAAAGRNHRFPGRHAAASRGCAGRVRGHAHDARLPPGARRYEATQGARARLGARHQSGHGRDVRFLHGGDSDRPGRQRRPRHGSRPSLATTWSG